MARAIFLDIFFSNFYFVLLINLFFIIFLYLCLNFPDAKWTHAGHNQRLANEIFYGQFNKLTLYDSFIWHVQY